MFLPDEIIFAPVQACNLKCPHCFVPNDGQRLELEKALAFLDCAARDGINRVGFSGGEPFLALPFLCAASEAAVERDMLFDRIMTNAVWWRSGEQLCDALQKLCGAGFDGTFGISFDVFHGQSASAVAAFIAKAEEIWQSRSVCSLVCVRSRQARQNERTLAMLGELAAALNAKLVYAQEACAPSGAGTRESAEEDSCKSGGGGSRGDCAKSDASKNLKAVEYFRKNAGGNPHEIGATFTGKAEGVAESFRESAEKSPRGLDKASAEPAELFRESAGGTPNNSCGKPCASGEAFAERSGANGEACAVSGANGAFPIELRYNEKRETRFDDGRGYDSIPIETIDFISEDARAPEAWQSDEWFAEDFCAGPGNVYYVHANGDVAACCGYANEMPALVLGNINTAGYTEIKKAGADSVKKGFLKTVYKSGLLKEARKLEKRGTVFPGKGRTSDNCTFCRWLVGGLKV